MGCIVTILSLRWMLIDVFLILPIVLAFPVNAFQHYCTSKQYFPSYDNGYTPTFKLLASPNDIMNDLPPTDSVPLILLAALGIGFTAQSWINFQLGGDRGLGSFLSDGSGFNRSAFRPRSGTGDISDGTAPVSTDPMPWLKLPRLDFVEVAGQEPMSSPIPLEEMLEESSPDIWDQGTDT